MVAPLICDAGAAIDTIWRFPLTDRLNPAANAGPSTCS
jgi:hypothetical protein